MTLKPPSDAEDEYFAREEALKKHKLAVEKARAMESAERERLKQLHFMHCPKCGMDLETTDFKGIQIDRCNNCNGIWLDEGEIERMVGKEPNLIGKIAAVFRRG
jgi:uncharacterized protein